MSVYLTFALKTGYWLNLKKILTEFYYATLVNEVFKRPSGIKHAQIVSP
jgi:hypothetical protein